MESDSISEHSTELVIGLVAPIGADLRVLSVKLNEALKLYGYSGHEVKMSKLIEELCPRTLPNVPPYSRVDEYMTAGDEIREESARGDLLVLAAATDMYTQRELNENGDANPILTRAWIFNSLKHPDEVRTLREIYGVGFLLLGVHSSLSSRIDYLVNTEGMTLAEAQRLIDRDESEKNRFGQQTTDTFALADAYLSLDGGWAQVEASLKRTLDLVFGNHTVTPTDDEYAMFLAYASSTMSGDLSRQVGATIVTEKGDLVATGTNDAPKFGGGVYSEGSDDSQRDIDRSASESNHRARVRIVEAVLGAVGMSIETLEPEQAESVKTSGVYDLTEYGRSVHAEMDAILSCARKGISTFNASIYCTTFPCHNCARHIIASGIRKVVFIEPYPKSKANDLHSDAISIGEMAPDRVGFCHFVGIGPRRFIDFFSLNLGGGRTLKREDNGKPILFDRTISEVRQPMPVISYLERERYAATVFLKHHRESGDTQQDLI